MGGTHLPLLRCTIARASTSISNASSSVWAALVEGAVLVCRFVVSSLSVRDGHGTVHPLPKGLFQRVGSSSMTGILWRSTTRLRECSFLGLSLRSNASP
eukprot:IDg211t1